MIRKNTNEKDSINTSDKTHTHTHSHTNTHTHTHTHTHSHTHTHTHARTLTHRAHPRKQTDRQKRERWEGDIVKVRASVLLMPRQPISRQQMYKQTTDVHQALAPHTMAIGVHHCRRNGAK